MRQLLQDSWQFCPDLKRSTILESKPAEGATFGRRARRIPGIMAESGVVGGNGRRYPRNVWENNLKPGSTLRQKMAEGSAWGQLEHPKDGIVDLSSNMAFHLVEASINAEGQIEGVIEIYEDLPEGHKLSVLIDHGYKPKVSSRGMGSIIKAADGVDDVDLDYICEGWDAVATPSFGKAILRPELASLETKTFPAAGRVSESATENPKAGIIVPTRKDPSMNMTQVRESIPYLRSLKTSEATPVQLAEGFARITECHRALSAEAADATKTWDCGRLHEELNSIAESWTKEIAAPKAEAARLTESNKRLVAVTEAAVKTVKQYRGQLTETTKKNVNLRKMAEALVGKVRGWTKVCEARDTRITVLTEKFDVATLALDEIATRYKKNEEQLQIATEALDILASRYKLATEALDLMTDQYHTDTTKLGSEILKIKNPEALKDEKVAESLKAAKTMTEVKAVQESIKASASPEAKKLAEAKELETKAVEPKKLEEAAKGAAKKEGQQTIPAAGRSVVTVESVQVINLKPTDSTTLNETVELVRRQGENQRVNL